MSDRAQNLLRVYGVVRPWPSSVFGHSTLVITTQTFRPPSPVTLLTHFPPHACSLLSSCTEHYTLQAAHQLTKLVTASCISFLRLAFGRRRHSQVHVFVQFGCKVPGHLSTAIVVAVALGYVIHIMEDQAVPIQVLHGFLKADIEKHGSVKGLGTNLKKQTILKQRPYCLCCTQKGLLGAKWTDY